MSSGAMNCPFLTLRGFPSVRRLQKVRLAEGTPDLNDVEARAATSACSGSWMSEMTAARPCLTSARSRALLPPGPRKESREERLALSNDDLKTTRAPVSSAISGGVRPR